MAEQFSVQSLPAVALAALLPCLGCAPEVDLPSEIKGLRVLAVQKSAPYAKPGESVDTSHALARRQVSRPR